MAENTMKGTRVLVVGASAGIGRAVAQQAVRDGASVVFAARRKEALDAAVAEAGGGTAVTADVRNPDDCARLARETADALGEVDVVVYATAVSPLRRIAESDRDTWAQVLETNLVGVNEVVRAVLPNLADNAVVAVLSSDSVGTPRPGLVPYASSKAALEELVRGWRNEHRQFRWMCITVGPTVPTEFGVHFDPELMGELWGEWAQLGMTDSAIMETAHVAEVIIGSLQLLGTYPGVNCDHIVLRPASGAMSIDREEAFEAMRREHEA
jgi:NAD(P)-dependent dehydrogenase (short-subunit alcohol dehydrogenase family)